MGEQPEEQPLTNDAEKTDASSPAAGSNCKSVREKVLVLVALIAGVFAVWLLT